MKDLKVSGVRKDKLRLGLNTIKFSFQDNYSRAQRSENPDTLGYPTVRCLPKARIHTGPSDQINLAFTQGCNVRKMTPLFPGEFG